MEDFPFRKYELEPFIKEKLKIILNSKPNIIVQSWSFPSDKLVKNVEDIYYLSDTVIKPSLNDHWNYDKIIDYYSEYARVNTPGYGEKYSVYEYWSDTKLHDRWKPKNTYIVQNARELLYKNITEARPAYATVSISLYKALSNLFIEDNFKHIILDIAAYGERAIAATSLQYEYHGVDPNIDLIEGHTKLIMDLQCLDSNSNVKFYYIGLENFKSIKKFSIITYSPPPYNTEPYSKNTDNKTQTYNKYNTYYEYICNFLTEIIYKASVLIIHNGIFSFTALDRNPKSFPPKIQKQYISENLELIYVETILLITSCLGFTYKGAIGLSVGDKPAQVPWWTYIYSNEYDVKYIKLLYNNYRNIYDRIGSRLLLYYNDDTLFDKHRIVKEVHLNNNVFKISNIKVNNIDYSYEQLAFLELCRLRIQEYICTIVSDITNIHYNKIRTILGRYLMLRSITGTYTKPWLNNLFVDVVFPTYSRLDKDNVLLSKIHDNLINNLQENGYDNAKYIVYEHIYWFNSYQVTGIVELYDIVAQYMLTIPVSKVSLKIEKLYPNKIKIYGNENAIEVMKNIPGNKMINTLLNEQRSDIGTDDQNILILLRYETLSAKGHQYTRSKNRINILEDIFNEDLIDIYASYYNNQSDYYCSIYPDVELNSYGSAFHLHMKEGSYLANPVDAPVFLEESITRIIKDLKHADKNNKKINVSMSFTVWLDIEPSFMSDFNSKNIKKNMKSSKNIGLQMLYDSKYLKVIYILDKNKFPSTIKGGIENHKSNARDNAISVGVILSVNNDMLDLTKVNELAYSDKYIIF